MSPALIVALVVVILLFFVGRCGNINRMEKILLFIIAICIG